jgi:beta-lactam-binding protein with PASTA domain
VLIVVAKPLHGVIPKVIGLSVAQAKLALTRQRLSALVEGTGKVVGQDPPAGVAAAPGLSVRLSVARG